MIFWVYGFISKCITQTFERMKAAINRLSQKPITMNCGRQTSCGCAETEEKTLLTVIEDTIEKVLQLPADDRPHCYGNKDNV